MRLGPVRTVEVSVGAVLLFLALYIAREIGRIVSGQQDVSGGDPTVIVVFLAAVGIALGVYGFHVIRKGF